MVILDSPRYEAEEVWGDEEGVEDAAATVKADKGELVCQSYAERDMMFEREAEEEEAGY